MSAFFVPTRFTWRFGGSVVGQQILSMQSDEGMDVITGSVDD